MSDDEMAPEWRGSDTASAIIDELNAILRGEP
jgi:hypothetical protein